MLNTHKDSRNPFEIWLLGACALAGTVQLISGARPGSLSAQLTPVAQTAWCVLLGFGGVVALIGIFWNGQVKVALEMESIGLTSVTVACLVYAVGIFFAVAWDGLFSVVIYVTVALCCLIRRRRIEKVLKPTRKRRWVRGVRG
jgi:hypothetical protein